MSKSLVNPGIPSCGVIDDLLRDIEPDPVKRFEFWLLLHCIENGPAVVDKLVRDRCLPKELKFKFAGDKQ